MSQNLTIYPVSQVPHVTSPNLLNSKVMIQLTAHRLNQSANPLSKLQLLIIQMRPLAVLGGNRKLKSLILKKFLPQWQRCICLVTKKQASIGLGKFCKHLDVVNISCSKVKSLNHPYRVDLQMQAKTIKGLIAKFFSIGSNSLEKFGSFGPCESANGNRKAIQHRDGVRKTFSYGLKQFLLDRPKVGCMANEVYSIGQIWKVVLVEVFKKPKDFSVGLKAHVFAYDFHCKYFAIRKLWRGASLSEGSIWKMFFHKIIYLAEDIYDKIIKIHFFALHGLGLISVFYSHRPEGIFCINPK